MPILFRGGLLIPNDPTSLAAYVKCEESENPLNDPTCVKLNLSAHRISLGLDNVITNRFESLFHIDEAGELLNGLVNQVISATFTGVLRTAAGSGLGQNIRVGAARDLGTYGTSVGGGSRAARRSSSGGSGTAGAVSSSGNVSGVPAGVGSFFGGDGSSDRKKFFGRERNRRSGQFFR